MQLAELNRVVNSDNILFTQGLKQEIVRLNHLLNQERCTHEQQIQQLENRLFFSNRQSESSALIKSVTEEPEIRLLRQRVVYLENQLKFEQSGAKSSAQVLELTEQYADSCEEMQEEYYQELSKKNMLIRSKISEVNELKSSLINSEEQHINSQLELENSANCADSTEEIEYETQNKETQTDIEYEQLDNIEEEEQNQINALCCKIEQLSSQSQVQLGELTEAQETLLESEASNENLTDLVKEQQMQITRMQSEMERLQNQKMAGINQSFSEEEELQRASNEISGLVSVLLPIKAEMQEFDSEVAAITDEIQEKLIELCSAYEQEFSGKAASREAGLEQAQEQISALEERIAVETQQNEQIAAQESDLQAVNERLEKQLAALQNENREREREILNEKTEMQEQQIGELQEEIEQKNSVIEQEAQYEQKRDQIMQEKQQAFAEAAQEVSSLKKILENSRIKNASEILENSTNSSELIIDDSELKAEQTKLIRSIYEEILELQTFVKSFNINELKIDFNNELNEALALHQDKLLTLQNCIIIMQRNDANQRAEIMELEFREKQRQDRNKLSISDLLYEINRIVVEENDEQLGEKVVEAVEEWSVE